jgi:predicted nuclease of predicted toxin-antitoxin system
VKLKLDENLGPSSAEPLREAGHDVASVKAQALAGCKDRDLIAACREEGRGLVTLDVEFGNPLLFDPADYPGIAVIRIPGRIGAADLRLAMETLSAALQDRDITGRLWIVQRGRIREYQQD